jgi:isoleucyl-tRNA synthetase
VAEGDKASAGMSDHAGVVALDIDVTEELEVEGRARDLVRLIQQARREADLDVSDRIDLTITAAPVWIEAIGVHEPLISAETLATSITAISSDGELDPVIDVAVASP